MNYTAICFDLDGVIVDSEPLHRAAFRSTLSYYGHQLSDYDYEKHFAGKTDEQGFKSYFDTNNIQTPSNDLITTKNDAYAQLAEHGLIAYAGVPELIHMLHKETSLALVTGSSLNEAKLALASCGISSCFSTIVTADDISIGKPDPEGYLLATHRLNSSTLPANCIAIEDSPSGVQAAKSAGMYCVAITTTHSAEQLQLADIIVDQLSFDMFTKLIAVH